MNRESLRGRWSAFASALAIIAGGGLAGCRPDAPANPNAPGQPGTGNATESAAPQQPDARAGGSTEGPGITPPPDASGGEFPQGATGSGRVGAVPGGSGSAAQAPSSASVPAPTQGSPNRTPGSRY